MNKLTVFFLRPGSPEGSRPIATIRAMAGAVFVISGLLKFLYVNQGVGRFTKIGLPSPELLAPFVGAVEITCGALLIVGLLTRVAALPLIIDMVVAIASTKVPLLFGVGAEPIAAPPKTGVALWMGRRESGRDLEDRALRMVTASDVVPLRLVAAAGVPAEAHGTYRARVGSQVAVLTATNLPPPGSGEANEAWVEYGDEWTWLGSVTPGDDGRAVVFAEVRVPTAAPRVVRVTREASGDRASPHGAVVIEWASPSP